MGTRSFGVNRAESSNYIHILSNLSAYYTCMVSKHSALNALYINILDFGGFILIAIFVTAYCYDTDILTLGFITNSTFS